MTMKLKSTIYGVGDMRSGEHYSWVFWCPGCEQVHQFDARWAFNGDRDRPTFTPSLLVNGERSNPTAPRCHLHLAGGMLQFLADCTHAMAGKTVSLPDLPEEWR